MHGGDVGVCWEWEGYLTSNQRPCFDVDGRKVTPYRVVYELTNGEKIPKGMVVRHKCDNGVCCNPRHLEIGTHRDNMNDMKERNRHGLPKIALNAIHKLILNGKSDQEIAELYGVDRSTINRIRNKHKDVDFTTQSCDDDDGKVPD
jgi:hypothetical protein